MLSKIKNILRYLHILYLRYKTILASSLQLNGKVMILAPHPDDEALGCGGLIARLCNNNNPPMVVILSGGGASLENHSDIDTETVIEERRQLTLKSARKLGLPLINIRFMDFQDGNIGNKPESEMENVRNLITEYKPDVILLPHSCEGWPDHIAVREIGLELAPSNCSLYEYCVWMWYYNVWNLDWINARKLGLTKEEHYKKLEAVDAYILPESPDGHKWSGELPKPFLTANTGKTELYFLVRNPQ